MTGLTSPSAHPVAVARFELPSSEGGFHRKGSFGLPNTVTGLLWLLPVLLCERVRGLSVARCWKCFLGLPFVGRCPKRIQSGPRHPSKCQDQDQWLARS